MAHNLVSANRMQRQFAPPGNVNNAHNMQKPLNFCEAMSDFKTMFPEIDRDVIETVLRANNGVVQPTIDQLLVLQETTAQEKQSISSKKNFPILPSYESSLLPQDEAPPAYSDIWEDVEEPQQNVPSPISFDNPVFNDSSNTRWQPRLLGKLPADFLRLDIQLNDNPSPRTRNTSMEDFMTEDEVEQFLEDEKLAMFLQNEEFIRQLRRNKEFVSALDEDHRRAVADSGGTVGLTPVESVAIGGARRKVSTSQEDAVFKQKLRHMGKSTRRKFGKMAKKFSRTRSTSKQAMMASMHPSESTFNLLEEDEETDDQSEEGIYNVNEEGAEYDGDIETEEETVKQIAQGARRRLPQPPGAQASITSSGTDEPIVFYGEDNEFAYKNEQ